jgi:hypothetical protein
MKTNLPLGKDAKDKMSLAAAETGARLKANDQQYVPHYMNVSGARQKADKGAGAKGPSSD